MLEVSEVSSIKTDAYCQQGGVYFRHIEGPELGEGTYRMQGSTDVSELFLQPTADGVKALLSRLI